MSLLLFFLSVSSHSTLCYRARMSPSETPLPNLLHSQLRSTDYFFGDDVIPPPNANCFSLLVQSGDAEKEHDDYKFSKILNSEEFFMPLWSLDEMKALNQALPRPVLASASCCCCSAAAAAVPSLSALRDRDVELRFFQWGGCVRSVFRTAEPWISQGVKFLIDKSASMQILDNAVGKTRSNPQVLGRLIHLDVDPDTFQVAFLFFCSLISFF